MITDERFRSIGGEKFWHEAVYYAYENIALSLDAFMLNLYMADISRLYELVKAEIDHIADFDGMDKLPWYSKRFIEGWRKLNVEEVGEEMVKEYEEEHGPVYKRLGPLTDYSEGKYGTLGQVLKRLKLLIKFGIDSGIYSLKEKEQPWEIITSKISFPIDQSLKDNELVKELARFIGEDREDMINQREALQ